MELTGKCKEEFEGWFEDKYDNNNTSDVIMLQTEFDLMPFEFKYGVYVDYFDSVGIILEVNYVFHLGYWASSSIEKDGRYEINDECNTRQESRDKAIEKANEIRNKQFE